MNEITLNIEGQRVKVDESFLSLSPDEQNVTVEEIAQSLGAQPKGGFMPNLNQGIAEGAGGLVDLINPFDKPHNLNPFEEGTGSAVTGIERGMDAIGVDRAEGEPQTLVDSFARGTGKAAGTIIPAGKAAQLLRGAGGLIGNLADDASHAINSVRGLTAEMLAGGGAQAGSDLAEEAGAPEWAQLVAGIAGGAGVASVPAIAQRTPTALGARKLHSAVKAAAMPYTESGAREVARQRVQDLAGGPERAEQLAREIGPTEIGLSPAQQTGDPNLLALEQEAMRRSPQTREALDATAGQAQQVATDRIRDMGGDPVATQAFFEQRRAEFREQITGVVDRVTNGALRPSARNAETINSQELAESLRAAQSSARQQEAALWVQVPRDTTVGTQGAKQKAQELIAATPRAQRDDIPRVVQELLGPDSNSAFDDFETVAEMHGLYSKLREVAREARSGTNQQRNKARIADEIADAILDDLGSGAGQTEVARAIDTARAFSAEMHQTFTQGTVGRILKQSVDGDTALDPALALDRTVGRGGSAGVVAVDDIQAAKGSGVDAQIEDFLRSRFDKAAFKTDGSYNQTGARVFMRDHKEVMLRFPYLRDVFEDAMLSQSRAGRMSDRARTALTNVVNPSKSALAAFTGLPPEDAANAIFKAKRPSIEARKLAATARKDKSGEALEGLKGAFADHVIKSATDARGLNGEAILRFTNKPENKTALRAAFSDGDLSRMRKIGAELMKLRAGRQTQRDIGGLSPRSPNRLIEYAARVVAARQGAKAGGGGGASLQTAQMASGRVKELLGSLQNDKAEQMLIDAVSDPELFRLLLVDPGKVTLKQSDVSKLAPYFAGTGSALATEDQGAR